VVQLHLPEAYLRSLTEGATEDQAGVFATLHDEMFTELGLPLPRFTFVPDEDLGPRRMAFTVNHLRTPPMLGLPPGRALVNDTPERLRVLGVEATGVTSPGIEQLGALVDESAVPALQAAGLTTWDPLEHLLLVLAAALRANAHRLLDRRVVDTQLERLEQVFPALVTLARDAAPLDEMVGLLRALLAEQVSIANLRRILERLLDRTDPFMAAPPVGSATGNANRDDLVPFVRAALARQLQARHGHGTGTVIVYLLDRTIEALFGPGTTPEDEQHDRVLRAIEAEFAALEPTTVRPALLTTEAVRPALRAALAQELPRLTVLAYGDLPPDASVQPVARISLAP
jgi:flagellar biosynthesis protein FlhA